LPTCEKTLADAPHDTLIRIVDSLLDSIMFASKKNLGVGGAFSETTIPKKARAFHLQQFAQKEYFNPN
jgi:hypothetical protein